MTIIFVGRRRTPRALDPQNDPARESGLWRREGGLSRAGHAAATRPPRSRQGRRLRAKDAPVERLIEGEQPECGDIEPHAYEHDFSDCPPARVGRLDPRGESGRRGGVGGRGRAGGACDGRNGSRHGAGAGRGGLRAFLRVLGAHFRASWKFPAAAQARDLLWWKCVDACGFRRKQPRENFFSASLFLEASVLGCGDRDFAD